MIALMAYGDEVDQRVRDLKCLNLCLSPWLQVEHYLGLANHEHITETFIIIYIFSFLLGRNFLRTSLNISHGTKEKGGGGKSYGFIIRLSLSMELQSMC